MSDALADVRKIASKIIGEGKYLIVDFSQNIPQYHFGKAVNPRDALHLTRAKREYSHHLRRLGKSGVVSNASAIVRQQLKNIENGISNVKKDVVEELEDLTVKQLKALIVEKAYEIETKGLKKALIIEAIKAAQAVAEAAE